jgi:hypothetical protein
VFDLYKSANAHTMKARVPMKAWLLPVLLLLAVGAVVALPLILYRIKRHATAATAAVPASALKHQALVDAGLRQSDYAKWLSPRIPGLPWTAPAFDQLQVEAQPRIFCMAVADGKGTCGCISEQGTRIRVPPAVCRSIAADGVYDPFQKPVERDVGRGNPDEGGAGNPRREAAKPPGGDTAPPVVGIDGPHADRATAPAYQPPTYGAWNPEAL